MWKNGEWKRVRIRFEPEVIDKFYPRTYNIIYFSYNTRSNPRVVVYKIADRNDAIDISIYYKSSTFLKHVDTLIILFYNYICFIS